MAVQGLARVAAAWGAALVSGVRSWRAADGVLAIVCDGVGGQGNSGAVLELAGIHVLTLSRGFAAMGRPLRTLPPAARRSSRWRAPTARRRRSE